MDTSARSYVDVLDAMRRHFMTSDAIVKMSIKKIFRDMLSDNWTTNSIVIFGVMNRTTIRF